MYVHVVIFVNRNNKTESWKLNHENQLRCQIGASVSSRIQRIKVGLAGSIVFLSLTKNRTSYALVFHLFPTNTCPTERQIPFPG